MVRCIDCKHWNLRKAGKAWAAAGAAVCDATRKPWEFLGGRVERDCSAFDQAPAGTADKRAAYIDNETKEKAA